MKSVFVKTSDGVRLHYLEGGTKNGSRPALVFIPGFSIPADIWQPQLRRFSTRCRVIALDPRSHGKSDKPTDGHHPERLAADIHEVIASLGASPVVLVAWAFAVPQTLTYLSEYGSGQLLGLVLVDGFVGRETTLELIMDYARWWDRVQQNRQTVAAEFVMEMFAQPQPVDYLERLTAATMQVPTNTIVAMGAGFLTRLDQSAALARVGVPLMYVATESKRGQAELVRKHAPKARIEFIEGAGHAVFVDQPAQFSKVLDNFLESLVQRRAPR